MLHIEFITDLGAKVTVDATSVEEVLELQRKFGRLGWYSGDLPWVDFNFPWTMNRILTGAFWVDGNSATTTAKTAFGAGDTCINGVTLKRSTPKK